MTTKPWNIAALLLLAGFNSSLSADVDNASSRTTKADEMADGAESEPTVASVLPPIAIDGISLLVAKPGDLVMVTGENFRAGMTVVVNGVVIELTIVSSTKATFTMPDGVGVGLLDVSFNDGESKIKTLSLVSASEDLPIVLMDPERVCADVSFRDAKGDVKVGTRNCGAVPDDCAADGATGCVATNAFKAADTSGLAAKILSTATVAGVAGNVVLPGAGSVLASASYGVGSATSGTISNCVTNGVSGCLTTATYKSADLTNLSAANIKTGVTIAGQLGEFPSNAYPLFDSGAGGITTDLTTFATQLTTDGSFQFWDSTGGRHTGSGDSDIVNANVKSGVTFENLSVNGAVAVPNPWDVRFGAAVGATSGKLPTNCRNLANTTFLDQSLPQSAVASIAANTLTATAHGYSDGDQVRLTYTSTAPSPLNYWTTYFVVSSTPDTFKLSATSGGLEIDVTATGSTVYVFRVSDGVLDGWDTIDDNNGYGSILTQNPWSAVNACGGVEMSTDDEKVWKDVTSTTCDSLGDECRFKDKISGLEWTETAGTNRNWGEATAYCNGLTFDGQTGWRLPTQKELLGAYEHGIRSAANTNWITTAQIGGTSFWSSSTGSTNWTTAWNVHLGTGSMPDTIAGSSAKSTAYQVTCVR